MRGQDIGLIIFDCDGVLIDSEIISANILIDQLRSVGVNVDLDYVQNNFLGRSFPKVAADIRDQLGFELPDDFESGYRTQLLSAFRTGLKTTKGLEDMLDRLGPQACVATSSSPPRVRRSLELTDLNTRFGDRVFTASEVKNGKPAPDLFLHAARSMGFEPGECLIVEDSLPGVRAGLAAGMDVLWFVGASHLCGVQQQPPDDLKNVAQFDNWTMFFELMPGLLRSAGASEERP